MGDDNHTPGPWYVDSFLGSDSYEDPDMPFVEIGDVKWSPNRTSVPAALQQYTDAYLIAAAPDLLEACETFIEWSRREHEGFYDSEHSRDPETGFRYPEGSEEYRDAFWKWYDDNVDLCDLSYKQALSAIAKAKGE